MTAEDMAALEWVKPAVVVEVAFTEWTRDANLRHASYVGIRGGQARARGPERDVDVGRP